jgi:hypothetical protein
MASTQDILLNEQEGQLNQCEPLKSIAPFNIRLPVNATERLDSTLNYSKYCKWLFEQNHANQLKICAALPRTHHYSVRRDEDLRPDEPGITPERICTAHHCERCETGYGGYQFRFIGPWTAEEDILYDPEGINPHTFVTLNTTTGTAASLR